MSHYIGLVLLPEGIDPSNEDAVRAKIDELLAPFDANLDVPPYKDRIPEEQIDELKLLYRGQEETVLDTDEKIIAKLKDWNGEPAGKDEEGFYTESRYNQKALWDYWLLDHTEAVVDYLRDPRLPVSYLFFPDVGDYLSQRYPGELKFMDPDIWDKMVHGNLETNRRLSVAVIDLHI